MATNVGDAVLYMPETEALKEVENGDGDTIRVHPDDKRAGKVIAAAYDEAYQESKGAPLTAKVVRVRDDGTLDLEVAHPAGGGNNPWIRRKVPFGRPSPASWDLNDQPGRPRRINHDYAFTL